MERKSKAVIKKNNEMLKQTGKTKMTLRTMFNNISEKKANSPENKQITQCVFLGALCLKPVPNIFQVALQEHRIRLPFDNNNSGKVENQNMRKRERKNKAEPREEPEKKVGGRRSLHKRMFANKSPLKESNSEMKAKTKLIEMFTKSPNNKEGCQIIIVDGEEDPPPILLTPEQKKEKTPPKTAEDNNQARGPSTKPTKEKRSLKTVEKKSIPDREKINRVLECDGNTQVKTNCVPLAPSEIKINGLTPTEIKINELVNKKMKLLRVKPESQLLKEEITSSQNFMELEIPHQPIPVVIKPLTDIPEYVDPEEIAHWDRVLTEEEKNFMGFEVDDEEIEGYLEIDGNIVEDLEALTREEEQYFDNVRSNLKPTIPIVQNTVKQIVEETLNELPQKELPLEPEPLISVEPPQADKPPQEVELVPDIKLKTEDSKEKVKLVKRWHQCKVCLRIFESYNKLKNHKLEHAVRRPYECRQCGHKYPNLEQLTGHLRVHQGKMPYECKKCEQSFWTQDELEKHQPIHVLKKVSSKAKKIFKCEVCLKEFFKLCDLERHTRVHTGEKPSVCNICNKRFQQAYNLNKHLLIHTQEKNFECVICHKKFGRNDVLSRHILTHSIDKPHQCKICAKTFIRISQLNLHHEKHHKEAPKEPVEKSS